MPKKRTKQPDPKGVSRPRENRQARRNEAPPTPPSPLPPERPVEDSDGLNFITLVEAASPKNTTAKRKDPTIDVADLPVVFVTATGGPRTPGTPFRLSVPDLGAVIGDPQFATLAPEGKQATCTLKASPSLRVRAEKYATRVVGPLAWRWAKPRRDRPITLREEKFLEWLADSIVDQMMEERRAARSRSGQTSQRR